MKLSLTSKFPIDFNLFAGEYMERVREAMTAKNYEIAHLKLFAKKEEDYAKVSLTDNGTDIEFNHQMDERWSDYELYINARISSDPDFIYMTSLSLLDILGDKYDYTYNTHNIEHFRPGDPPDPNARKLNMAG